MNNIVLIQLRRSVRDAPYHMINLCQKQEEHGTKLGTCSMGSTLARRPVFPSRLKETFFAETKFLSQNPYDMRLCREDIVCVEQLRGIPRSNLCFKDDGAPLYTLKCGLRVPDCLYGIASNYENYVTKSGSYGKSYFASVPHAYEWIVETIYGQWQIFDNLFYNLF